MANAAAYGNLAQLRKRNKVADADIGDDQRYLEKLRTATEAIDDYCNRAFWPVQAAYKFDYESANRLTFRYLDLLALTSVADSYHTLNPSSMVLLGEADASTGPWYALEVIPTLDFFQWLNTPTRALTVTGVWGWHDNYANAWLGANLNGTVADASSPTLTLSADPALTANAWGLKPAFSAGDLIQIESEWLVVIATTTTTATVLRGQNGSVAAAHSAKAISVYRPPEMITEACLTWAAYLLVRDDADEDRIVISGMGDKSIPPSFPKRIYDLLNGFSNVRVS